MQTLILHSMKSVPNMVLLMHVLFLLIHSTKRPLTYYTPYKENNKNKFSKKIKELITDSIISQKIYDNNERK